MKQAEFWFEFASTYSYPAAMRIEMLAAENGVELLWRPFLLGPIFKEQGWGDSPFNLYPAKGDYMWRDMHRLCDAQEIAFKRPSVFPRNGLLAARVACRYCNEEWLPGFVREIYRANFEFDLDIASPDVVSHCLEKCGLSARVILLEAATDGSKELLKQRTEQARRAGIFGAPSVLIGKELFWGNDRLETAMEWASEE